MIVTYTEKLINDILNEFLPSVTNAINIQTFCKTDTTSSSQNSNNKCRLWLNSEHQEEYGYFEIRNLKFDYIFFEPFDSSVIILESISSIKVGLSSINVNATFDFELSTPFVLDSGTG